MTKFSLQATHIPLLRRVLLMVWLPLTLISLGGLGGLSFNSHYSVYFDGKDPIRLEHESITDQYSRGDSVLVILQSQNGSFLMEDHYRLLEELTNELGDLPDVSKVISITKLDILGDTPTNSGLFLPSLDQMKSHDQVMGLLLNQDASSTVIKLDYQLTDRQADSVLKAIGALKEIVEQQTSGMSINAHYSGTLVMNAAYIDVVRDDLVKILPLLLATMMIVLGILLGSYRTALSLMPIGILSVLIAFGVVGWFQPELAAINAFTPIMILTISMAGCVHMVLSYEHYRKEGL